METVKILIPETYGKYNNFKYQNHSRNENNLLFTRTNTVTEMGKYSDNIIVSENIKYFYFSITNSLIRQFSICEYKPARRVIIKVSNPSICI